MCNGHMIFFTILTEIIFGSTHLMNFAVDTNIQLQLILLC